MAYLALFVALGGGALAASSLVGSDGKIHACVGKNGHPTLVKAGAKCAKGSSSIAWNQKGPPGRRGAQGPGAKQFEQGLAPGALTPVQTVNGVKVVVDCGNAYVTIVVKADHYSGFWWAGRGGAVTMHGYSSPESAYDTDLAHVDVIAKTDSVNKWTHFQVVGERRSGYCLISGLITPPSN